MGFDTESLGGLGLMLPFEFHTPVIKPGCCDRNEAEGLVSRLISPAEHRPGKQVFPL
jgi:hypothetical protein